MAFPTRHWRMLAELLEPGERSAIPHGLRDGEHGTTITPDAVLVCTVLQVAGWNPDEPINTSIGGYAISDATNIYLSNWDGAAAHRYCVIARSYFTDDDANF